MAKMLTGRAQQMFQDALRSQLQGKFDAAAKLYQRVLQTNPKHVDSLSNLGSIQFQRGQMAQAHKLLSRAVKADPRNLQAQSMLGTILHGQGEYETAIQAYRTALDVKSDDFTNLYNLANVLAETGQMDEAAEHYEHALKLRPGQAPILVNLGNVRLMQGQVAAARKHFEDVLQIDATNVHARVNLGNILSMNGEVTAAIEMLSELVAEHPREMMSRVALGTSLEDNGDYALALAEFEAAIEIEPQNVEALRRRANMLNMLDRNDEAIAAFEALLELHPDDQLALRNVRRARRRKFPAWHLQLLNDVERNQKFDAAIRAAVTPETQVLDIGSGSGLLAMMAVRAGAAGVTACEMNPLISPITRRVIKDNNMTDKITVFEAKSTKLRVGQELPERADCVLAEVVDAGLLGEGILPTMRHAVQNLAGDSARLIPRAARVFATLVRAPRLRLINPVAQVEGFDISAFDDFRVPYEYVRVDARRDAITMLSPVVEAFGIDFSNPPSAPSQAGGHTHDLSFDVESGGDCHGIMFWFELDLGADITINSGPGPEFGADDVHWGQALYFFEEGVTLEAGIPLQARLHHSDTQIWFSLPDYGLESGEK